MSLGYIFTHEPKIASTKLFDVQDWAIKKLLSLELQQLKV